MLLYSTAALEEETKKGGHIFRMTQMNTLHEKNAQTKFLSL